MPFPETPRVIFDNNPLREVICQLRYPRIMRIESTPPADFQDRIRQSYPLPEEKTLSQIPPQLFQFLSTNLVSILKSGSNRQAYDFYSMDKEWQVGLTSEFVSLSSYNYTRWGEFARRIDEVLEALTEVYNPVFFSRVGLRFVNVIEKETYGLQSSRWRDLLNPNIIGLHASNHLLDEEIVAATHTANISLGDDGNVTMRLGLAEDKEGNKAFLIDNDFFVEGEIDNVRESLGRFHTIAGHVFRHCISSSLYEAMGPRTPD